MSLDTNVSPVRWRFELAWLLGPRNTPPRNTRVPTSCYNTAKHTHTPASLAHRTPWFAPAVRMRCSTARSVPMMCRPRLLFLFFDLVSSLVTGATCCQFRFTLRSGLRGLRLLRTPPRVHKRVEGSRHASIHIVVVVVHHDRRNTGLRLSELTCGRRSARGVLLRLGRHTAPLSCRRSSCIHGRERQERVASAIVGVIAR